MLESAPMRLRSTSMKLAVAVATGVAALVASVPASVAQVIVSPNAKAERNDGGWIYWIAIALVVLGVLIALSIVLRYMRYAPRFQREEGAFRTVRAPRIQPGREAPRRSVNITGAPAVVAAPAVAVALAAPAAAVATVAAPSPAPAPAPAPASAAAPATPVTEAGPAVAAPAASPAVPAPAAAEPAAPAGERREVPIDQETFDRVLAELLEQGTTRRVAEGQARRAAMIAARKKAGG